MEPFVDAVMTKYVDGFDIMVSEDAQPSHTVAIGFAKYNVNTQTRTWDVEFFDYRQAKLMYRRSYKTLMGLLKALRAHCELMNIDWESVEQIHNVVDCMIDNPYEPDAEKSKWRYKNGPTHDLLTSFYPGLSAHIGDGVWVSRCASCLYAVAHYGCMPRYGSTGHHEVAEHGTKIPGINVGLLS